MALAVMGILLGLLLLGHLTVDTYGKAESGVLAAIAGLGKRLGGWCLISTKESLFLLGR